MQAMIAARALAGVGSGLLAAGLAWGDPGAGLIGKWTLSASSFPVGQACQAFAVEFTRDGRFIADDGSLVETKNYRVTRKGNGLLIRTTYVANNGRPNCQGVAAAEVRSGTLDSIYAELSQEGGELTLYFGEHARSEFLVLVRSRPD